jgi:hypothetical protein
MGTPHLRRATDTDTDAAAVARLVPGLVPSATDERRATFVIDGDTGITAVLELVQADDHMLVEHFKAPDEPHARLLADFADAAARGIGSKEIRLAPGAMDDGLAKTLGYRDGRRKIRRGHLEAIGVPLWRDGTAPFSQLLYYRGVWAAIALLIGLGSVSIAVFGNGELTWAHIAVPAVLCMAGTLFAVWQIYLVVKAAERTGRRWQFALTAGVAAASVFLIGLTVWDRAVPALDEMWNLYTGDARLGGDLDVTVSADGRTLYVEGTYGMRSEDAVRQALRDNKGIREVVLAGPGGRAATGFELFRMFRERKLATRVDSGCASACTLAFLGGVERSIGPKGRLGFHRASFPGMDDSDMYESNRGIRRFLIYSARLTPAFADRVFETPPDSIWVPTAQELLAGGVINRVNP